MIEILMSKETEDFLKQKGSHYVITLTVMGSGWCKTLQPTVKVGKPTNTENFEVVEKDELTFYLSKDCYSPTKKISIELKGFWLFKNIELKGIKGRF